jgi:predicted nucleotidyltransferase
MGEDTWTELYKAITFNSFRLKMIDHPMNRFQRRLLANKKKKRLDAKEKREQREDRFVKVFHRRFKERLKDEESKNELRDYVLDFDRTDTR